MELDITELVNNWHYDPKAYSASIMEVGPEAQKLTWARALDWVDGDPLVTTMSQISHCVQYFESLGAWSDNEIAEWTYQELNATLLQEISATLRDGEDSSGRIFRGDDGRAYFYLGV